MEAALVFRRVCVLRPAACPSKGGPCKYVATLLPRTRLDDRPPPPAPVKTPESRRGAFLRSKRPVPVLMNLFICVVLVLFVVPCPGSHGAATRAPADLPRESSQNGRRNISEDSGENVEVPGSPSSADQASGSVVSTPSHAEEHIEVQTVSKKEAHIDSPHAHSTAEVPTEEGTDAEVGRENAASAEKRAVGEVEPAAAPEDAVEEAESTKTVSDGNQKSAQAHKETPRGGEENTAVRMNPPADMSSARNREEESPAEEGKVNAPQNQNNPAADSSETGAGENSVTLDNWLAALAIASLNPAEAAAVAAELPVVPLSKQEQMLVQQLLLRNGSNHLASYLKESSRESDMGVDKIAGEEAVTDDTTDKEIYNVAVKELQAYKPTLHRRLPSYDSVPRQQRDLIQRRAAEIILLRLRDTMLAHAQKEYKARQERLRQGLSSEPHFLLEVIEKIRRNPGTNPSQDIRPAKAQHSRSTADSETTTPDESFTARKEPIRRERNSGETPHWGFVKRQLERMEHSYGTQTEKERQVVPLHAGDVEGQPELEGPSSAAERQNSQASIAGAHGESLYTQLHQTHEPQNITHAPDDRAVNESAQAPQHVEEEFEFEDIEAAARAISMPEEAQREDEASDESLETERLRRVAPQSLEVLKAAVLAGNPIALALLRYLPGDIPRLQGETSQGNDRLRGHPSAKLPAQPLVLPQDGTYQLHNPPPAASVHLHQATPQFENYAGKTRPDQEVGVTAPKRHPLEANEPLWRRQRGDTDDQTKPPLWITEYQPMDEDEDLQMQTATDTSRSRRGQTSAEQHVAPSAEQHVAPSAEQHVAPNTIEPNTIVDGQTNRKQLQATSTPTLQDFITSKSKASLGSATPHDTIQQADVDTEGTSAATDESSGPYITLQQTVNQERLQTERKDGREGQLSPTPTEYEAAVSGDTSYPPLEEKAGEAEGNGSGGLTDEEVEEQPLDASEVEMVANLPSLPSPGTRAPPMLFHVPHQHLSTPYTQGTTVQQTPPAVGDGYTFSHSPSKPAPQEYEGHPPEVLVNAPLQTDKDVALAASRSGNSSTEDEIAKFLKATLPILAVGSTLGHLPSFSSAGEVAAVVATGPTGDAAAAPSNPFVTFTGSPAVVSYSFSGAGDTDAGRKDTVTTWRFSPPTPPMLQTLPARGMFTEDTDRTQQGETLEERNREGTHITYISDSTVHFAPTALPYSSASMPPEQHPVPPYSLPASTLPTGERDAQVDASVFAQYVMPSTPWLTAGTWPAHPSFPSPSPADAHAPSYIGTGGSMHQPATIPSVETLASRPYIPLAAPLTPSHGHEAPDNHRAGPPVHSNVPRTYDAGEQLDEQETASTGRHMRGIGTGTALTAMVDGSARHAVGAAASALPQLAHSAEQLMTTTSALVNAGNALAKSLPIEEAAQLGQYLNDLRMRRKEGPPPPNFGEPSVRCMSSGMICCVPQKAVGPEWKKKPPYLNDSSPSNRVCQAHFVPLQDAVCAATEYDDKECGIERIETSSTVVFKHNLHMRGPKRLTAICECHWKQSKQENKTNEGESTPVPNKAPGETVEGFAQWKYSKKAMVEGQAARAKTEKLMSGLGAALKATALLTEQGSTVADSSSASTLQEADTSVDQSKRLRSGVSALADALLEDKANNPSMKYVKQALADIARAAGGA